MTVPADLRNPDRYEHGTRARYSAARCRCVPCRRANTRYETERVRRGAPNPLVPAAPVREHLARLTEAGVGLRAVRDATDVSRSTLSEVRRGNNEWIRAESARRILAVDVSAAADHAIIDGAETWRMLRELIAEGYRKGALALQLGRETPALQIRSGRVLAKTELAVRKLHAALLAESDEDVDIAVTPRERILSAIRFFDWVRLEDLLDAMDVEASERNTFTQAAGRLCKTGELERRGDVKPYEYRLRAEIGKRGGE